MTAVHPACANGKNCLSAFHGRPALLSPITGKMYCAKCFQAKWGHWPWEDRYSKTTKSEDA